MKLQDISSGNKLDASPDVFEKAVIGAILQSKDAIKIASQCDVEVFSGPRNQFVYGLLRERALKHTPLGAETAAASVHQAPGSAEHFSDLDSVTDYLDECLDISQPVSSWPEYVKQARLAFTRRKLLAAFDAATVDALSATSAEDAAANAIYGVIEAAGELRRTSVIRDDSKLNNVLERYVELYESENRIVGKFPQDWLNSSGGFRRGQVIIICAPTGTGKSWFSLDVALENAKTGTSSRIYTLEMDEMDISDRLLAMEGVAELDELIKQEVDTGHVRSGARELADLPISIIDRRISPGRIVADLAAMGDERPDCVVVDHLDLFHWKEGNETNALKNALANFKDAAKLYGVTFFLVAQFRRSRSDEEDKHPHIGMLKGGSAIEQIADMIIFLNAEVDRSQFGDTESVKMWVPKVRQGKFPGRKTLKFKNYRFR